MLKINTLGHRLNGSAQLLEWGLSSFLVEALSKNASAGNSFASSPVVRAPPNHQTNHTNLKNNYQRERKK
ncbi:MAG: hypothetical protein N2035_09790 [Chthoniobacterales bacterium]|nr:hypothetical protein [Chthoniobacterales bacterium]